MSKHAWAYLSCLALVVPLGCSNVPDDTPDLGKVTGVISIDGKPTADVIVMFSPVEGGRPSSGTTDASGNYELVYSTSSMGAKVGPHKVSISSNVEYPDEELEGESAPAEIPEGNVPEEYLEISKDVEVKAGKNEINLEFP